MMSADRDEPKFAEMKTTDRHVLLKYSGGRKRSMKVNARPALCAIRAIVPVAIFARPVLGYDHGALGLSGTGRWKPP